MTSCWAEIMNRGFLRRSPRSLQHNTQWSLVSTAYEVPVTSSKRLGSKGEKVSEVFYTKTLIETLTETIYFLSSNIGLAQLYKRLTHSRYLTKLILEMFSAVTALLFE